jgi:hypothetical protein
MNELPKNLHPMTIRDILEESIQLYRSNLLKFICIVLLLKGPYLIFSYIIVKLIDIIFTTEGPDQTMAINMSYFANMLMRLLEFISIGPILIAAMTIVLSERFLNNNINITETYKKILKRLLPLLGTIFLIGVIITSVLFATITVGLSAGQSGSFIIIIGGIMACVLWVWYAFIPQTVIMESEGGISAMKRSKYLVKGYFLKVFILVILVLMALALIMEILAFGIMKSLFFLGAYSGTLAEGASNVISIIFEPFRIIIVTLLYYDLRIRKEGFDLEIMAEEV